MVLIYSDKHTSTLITVVEDVCADCCLETVGNIGRYSKKRQEQNAKRFLKLIPICDASTLTFIIKPAYLHTLGPSQKDSLFSHQCWAIFLYVRSFIILVMPVQVSTVTAKPLQFFSRPPVGWERAQSPRRMTVLQYNTEHSEDQTSSAAVRCSPARCLSLA